jgi:sirohydrochlorin ferrochelatase
LSTGLVIFAHGSSIASANAAVDVVAEATAKAGGYVVRVGFLEPARPTLEDAVGSLAAAGLQRVLIVPYFLTLGLHLQRDLPRIVAHLEREHPGVEIRVTAPLDGHPALVQILLDRAREALGDWPGSRGFHSGS